MKRQEARKRAAELVGRMTLEEKASQLRFDALGIGRLGIPAYNWWNEALHEADEKASAILQAWYPGSPTGTAARRKCLSKHSRRRTLTMPRLMSA